VTDKVTNKPRGYAFVEFAHTRDMKSKFVFSNRPILACFGFIDG
jgi:RNA recognition motif-containing protein